MTEEKSPTRARGLLKSSILVSLLKNFSQIAMDAEGDKFGKIYEYFLGNFARAEGQRGGEFFTPTSLVKLIVEIIEPYHGRIYDPACGSGGMFAQSAEFIKAHQNNTELHGEQQHRCPIERERFNHGHRHQ